MMAFLKLMSSYLTKFGKEVWFFLSAFPMELGWVKASFFFGISVVTVLWPLYMDHMMFLCLYMGENLYAYVTNKHDYVASSMYYMEYFTAASDHMQVWMDSVHKYFHDTLGFKTFEGCRPVFEGDRMRLLQVFEKELEVASKKEAEVALEKELIKIFDEKKEMINKEYIFSAGLALTLSSLCVGIAWLIIRSVKP